MAGILNVMKHLVAVQLLSKAVLMEKDAALPTVLHAFASLLQANANYSKEVTVHEIMHCYILTWRTSNFEMSQANPCNTDCVNLYVSLLQPQNGQLLAEIELNIARLCSAIKWEAPSRGLGRFNDAAEFLDKLLEAFKNAVCITVSSIFIGVQVTIGIVGCV